MPDNENKEAPRKSGVSFSFILSILVVALTVGVIAYFMFGRNGGSTKLTTDQYIGYLYDYIEDDKVVIKSVQETPADTVITLRGSFLDPKKSNRKSNYIVSLYRNEYVEEIVRTITKSNGERRDVNTSLMQIIENAVTKAYLENSAEPALVRNPAVDPYHQEWYEAYGPTILTFVGMIILAVFLMSRFSSSVNGANNKALEFNKSRARRENISKIRFTDVAGADEEKQEMQELVAYLKEPKKFAKFGAKLPKGFLSFMLARNMSEVSSICERSLK